MGIIDLLDSRSLENPSTPLSDPDDWAWDAFGSKKSTSGIRVNRTTALTYAAVWRAITLISRDVGKLPMHLYKRIEAGKERDVKHPLYQLLRYKPNSEMTAFVFRQVLIGHALGDGNGYAYIYRNAAGRPIELIPMSPLVTYPVRLNGQLWYITSVNGQERKLKPENVIHIKGFSDDGLTGHNVFVKARESLGLGMAAHQYGSRFFSNNARPAVLLEHPARLGDEAQKNLVKSWNSLHQGLENSHKTAVLEEGMKANVIGVNAREAQLIETRQFEIRDVANWFGLPPHKLGDSSRTAYNSLEQENQSYLDDALDPWLVIMEEEFRDKLLTEKEKAADSHVIEFLRQALVRTSLTARAAYYRQALGGAPWMTINEVRAMENKNATDDEVGGKLLLPLNMKEAQAPDDDAVRQLLEEVVGRMVRRLGVHARKAARKPKTFLRWLEGIDEEHGETITDALDAPVKVLPIPAFADAVRARSALVAEIIAGVRAAAQQQYDTVSTEEFADAIDEVMTRVERELPATIVSSVLNPKGD